MVEGSTRPSDCARYGYSQSFAALICRRPMHRYGRWSAGVTSFQPEWWRDEYQAQATLAQDWQSIRWHPRFSYPHRPSHGKIAHLARW